jgi:transcriptional regulator with XRE-family HTH domain
VDAIRFGLQFRGLRVHKDLRQQDVGGIAGLSRAVISRIERGLIDNLQVRWLDRAAAALGATIEIRLRWHGEQLDRLLDEAHAAIVDRTVSMLRATGWEVAVEVSFSIWGERGSIDVLAYRPSNRILLAIEVKSVVPDSQATLRDLDRKNRLAARVAADRGWEVGLVARLLVVGDSATSRRRVERLAATYEVAFPMRGRDVTSWLRAPGGAMSGLLFLPYAPRGSASRSAPGRQRVRKRNRRPVVIKRPDSAPRGSSEPPIGRGTCRSSPNAPTESV